MSGFCHSRVPLRNNILASTVAINMEKSSAPNSANTTVQAIGLNNRPSTRCNVKMGK